MTQAAQAKQVERLRRRILDGETLPSAEARQLAAYERAHPLSAGAWKRRRDRHAAAKAAAAPKPEAPAPTAPPPLEVTPSAAPPEPPSEPQEPAEARAEPQAPTPPPSPPEPAERSSPPPVEVAPPAVAPPADKVAQRQRSIAQAVGFATGLMTQWDRELRAAGKGGFGDQYMAEMFAPSLANLLDLVMPDDVGWYGDAAVVGITGFTLYRARRHLVPAAPARQETPPPVVDEAPPAAVERAEPAPADTNNAAAPPPEPVGGW